MSKRDNGGNGDNRRPQLVEEIPFGPEDDAPIGELAPPRWDDKMKALDEADAVGTGVFSDAADDEATYHRQSRNQPERAEEIPVDEVWGVPVSEELVREMRATLIARRRRRLVPANDGGKAVGSERPVIDAAEGGQLGDDKLAASVNMQLGDWLRLRVCFMVFS